MIHSFVRAYGAKADDIPNTRLSPEEQATRPLLAGIWQGLGSDLCLMALPISSHASQEAALSTCKFAVQ